MSQEKLPSTKRSFYQKRNSLDGSIGMKNGAALSGPGSFRKSYSSFDGSKTSRKQELPQIRSEKQIDTDIYFNIHTRANFFKKLIDSYFVKNQPQSQSTKKNGKKSVSNSLLLSQSLISKKQPNLQRSLIDSKGKMVQNLTTSLKGIQERKSLKHRNGQNLSQIDKQDKVRVSYRYKRQNRGNHLIQTDETSSNKDFSLHLNAVKQEKNLIQKSPDELPFLPKITQAGDDIDQHHIEEFRQTTDSFMRGSSSLKSVEVQKKLMRQNNMVNLYRIDSGTQKLRVKQLKNHIFLQRHQKALSYGARTIWSQYRFDELSMCSDILCTLRDELFTISQNPTHPEHMIINPKQLYSKLLANHCQQLFILFGNFLQQMCKLKKNIINNGINTNNLYLLKDGKLCLGDWQYSAFRDENQINGGLFEKRVEPILKCDNEWLVEPEYLAPEILLSAMDESREFDLWRRDNVSDVYSIGLVFLEIITLIPLNISKKTSIKSNPLIRPRQGLLFSPNGSLGKIIESQKKLVHKMAAILETQIGQNQKNPKLFSLLLKMIDPNRDKRPTFDEILSEIL